MNAIARRLVIGVAATVAVQAAAVALFRLLQAEGESSSRPLEYEPLNEPARGLEARLVGRSGQELPLADHLADALLLHFWATWCEPCRRELPQLLALSRPRTLLVSVDENWPVIEHFFEGNVPPNVVLDRSAEARRSFGVGPLPDTFLLDAAGRPLARFRGAREWTSGDAGATLERLTRPGR